MIDKIAATNATPSPTPTESSLESLLGEVAGEFFDRMANGERPEIDEYVNRYPELADQIRGAFPALQVVGDSRTESNGLGTEDNLNGQKTLGDFRILRELGRGGMGVVYEAEQLSMGRKVALKVLPFTALAQEKSVQRFRNEVRAAGALNHPNIVPIHFVGEERGVHFFAMQLIRGQTMAEVIMQLVQLQNEGQPLQDDSISRALSVVARAGIGSCTDELTQVPDSEGHDVAYEPSRVSLETAPETKAQISTERQTAGRLAFVRSAARLSAQAADALQHAHEEGVLHRDIKPGNMMLDTEGQLYVTDFGLARMETDVGVTMTGDLVGTLRYMSPEQALAKRIVIDHRTDIYSLGVTLYELLTLRPSFDGENRQELLRQIAFEDPPKPRQISRSIPSELETIVLKAIEKNPDERYATAGELADDLRAFLENRPIKAKPPTFAQRSAKWSRRHRPLVWSACASSALLLLITMVFLVISNAYISGERDLKIEALEANKKSLVESEENFKLAVNTVEQFTTIVRDDPAFDDVAMQPIRRRLLANALAYYTTLVAKRGNDAPRVEIASAYWTIGQIHRKLGEWEESHRAHERALKIRKQLAQHEPDNEDYQAKLAESCARVAVFYVPGNYEKKLVKAEQLCNEACSIAGRLHKRDPSLRNSALLADVLYTSGQVSTNQIGAAGTQTAREKAIASAEAPLKQAIAIREKIVRGENATPDQTWSLAQAYRQLAQVNNAAGRADAAIALYRQAITYHAQIEGVDLDGGNKVAACLVELGIIQMATHDQTEVGLANVRKALAIAEEQKKLHGRLVWPRSMIARAYNAIGDNERSEERWNEAIQAHQTEIRELEGLAELGDTYQGQHWSLAHAYRELGLAHFEFGNTQAGFAAFDSAVKEWKLMILKYPVSPAYDHNYGTLLREWALLYERAGEIDDAIRVAWDCVRIHESLAKKHSENLDYQRGVVSVYEHLLRLSPNDAVASNRLAWFLATTANEQVRDAPRATKLARIAVEARENNGFYWYTLGVSYYRGNDWARAAEAFSTATKNRNDTSRGFAGFFIAMNTWRLNRKADALRTYRESTRWMDKQNPNDSELKRFRREAAALLDIRQP